MARLCTFCTARPSSREPVLAPWLARVLDGTDRWSAEEAEAGQAAIDLGDRSARIVCDACHAHFATTLEEPVSGLLRPAVLEAAPLALDAPAQELVARWAAVAAARVMAARRGVPGMPAAQRLALRGDELPRDCVVALGRSAVPTASLEVGRLRPPGGKGAGDADAAPWYLAATAGHLVVVAWGAGALPAGAELAPPPALQFARLTPPDGEVAWPPMWPLEAHDLQPLPAVRLQPART